MATGFLTDAASLFALHFCC